MPGHPKSSSSEWFAVDAVNSDLLPIGTNMERIALKR
jgi:hypothetical protein